MKLNGVLHYLMKNNETYSVAWTNGNIEGHIQGDLSVDDLKKMVDSIYEEVIIRENKNDSFTFPSTSSYCSFLVWLSSVGAVV